MTSILKHGLLLGCLALGLTFALASGLALAETSRNETGTNIIGSQEAPTVLNVVPWKEREVRLERKDPTTSLLDRVLEPLDQEVLLREIDYHERLRSKPE